MAKKAPSEKKEPDQTIHANLAKAIILSEQKEIPADAMSRILDQFELATARGEFKKKEKIEKQTVVIMFDPEGTMKGRELPVWTVRMIKGNDPKEVIPQLQKAIDVYNRSKDARLKPATCLADSIEGIPRGMFLDEFLWVEAREPCNLVVLDGTELCFVAAVQDGPGVDGDRGGGA
jgi:hypothetical protein